MRGSDLPLESPPFRKPRVETLNAPTGDICRVPEGGSLIGETGCDGTVFEWVRSPFREEGSVRVTRRLNVDVRNIYRGPAALKKRDAADQSHAKGKAQRKFRLA